MSEMGEKNVREVIISAPPFQRCPGSIHARRRNGREKGKRRRRRRLGEKDLSLTSCSYITSQTKPTSLALCS